MSLKVITPATRLPIDLEDLRAQLRLTSRREDEHLRNCLAAATGWAEQFTGRAFITRDYELRITGWPESGTIPLPRPPLQSVTSVEYFDEDGNEQTLNASTYFVETTNEPGVIVLKPDSSWPSLQDTRPLPVTITFKAGYGNDPANVPDDIKHALRYLAAHFFERRDVVNIGSLVQTIPFTVESLLSSHRFVTF